MNLQYNKHLIAVALCAAFAPSEAAGTSAAEAKRPRTATKDYDVDTGVVEIEFGNAEKTTLELNVYQLPEEMQKTLMLHGASQKIGDSYAGVKGDVAQAIKNAQAVIDGLKSGEWGSSGGEGGKPRLKELAAALARVKGVSEEDALSAVTAAAALDGTDEQKKAGKEKLAAWRANGKVKAALAEISAEKARAALQAEGDSAADPEL